MFSQPVASRLEAERDVEERADPALDDAAAARGRVDAGQQPEQRALAGAVVADDAEPVAVAEFQVEVSDRLHVGERLGLTAKKPHQQELLERNAHHLLEPKRQAHVFQKYSGHAKPRMCGRGGLTRTTLNYRWKINRFCIRAARLQRGRR